MLHCHGLPQGPFEGIRNYERKYHGKLYLNADLVTAVP